MFKSVLIELLTCYRYVEGYQLHFYSSTCVCWLNIVNIIGWLLVKLHKSYLKYDIDYYFLDVYLGVYCTFAVCLCFSLLLIVLYLCNKMFAILCGKCVVLIHIFGRELCNS